MKALLLLLAFGLSAAERVVPRVVLGVWDSEDEEGPRYCHIHRMAEMPLNHLGFIVELVDVNRPLPDLRGRPDVLGIVTWLQGDRQKDPAGYVAWLESAKALGKRIAVIGESGIAYDRANRAMPDTLLRRLHSVLGMSHNGEWSRITYNTHIVERSPIVDFEKPIGPALPPYEIVRATHPSARVHLRVRRDGLLPKEAHPVVTTPHGGWILTGFSHYSDEAHNVKWLVNPFIFFRLALGGEGLPIPDTATLSGRRIYYSHVDGDGWLNLAEIPEYRKERLNAAEVFRREIVEKYPDLPVTLGPVVADIDPDWAGTARTREQARQLLSYPWVEAGTHTYTHPLDWGFYERYDREAEKTYGKKEEKDYKVPRSYTDRPYDLRHDIRGSVDYLNALLPKGKRVELLQWSGNTSPFEAALREGRSAKLRNINGGDSRFDGEFPSYAWVAPLGIRVGAERQIYSSNSNENTYTDLWTRRFFGLQFLARTLEQTETPFRLKAFNLYYHLYSCEKLPGLQALKRILDLARSSPVIPVAASTYVAVADGFFELRIVETGPRRWRIENRDGLGTLRFEQASKLAVDFGRSKGVLGQTWHQGNLYVSLDAAEPYPEVALGARGEDSTFHLVESRWRIWKLRRDGAGWLAAVQGFGPGEFVWKTRPSARYEVELGGDPPVAVTADGQGFLRFRLSGTAYTDRPLRIRPAGAAS